ncbi:uncharacterized protein LOC130731930, partial [Lotus japonicus]|uniref:uncharacterized protein LOC130731930 n=1 Tax=Lotus japonicus TaxID=34305 RepID=UPI002586FC69
SLSLSHTLSLSQSLTLTHSPSLKLSRTDALIHTAPPPPAAAPPRHDTTGHHHGTTGATVHLCKLLKVMDKFLVKRARSSSEQCGSSSSQQQPPHVEVNLNELPSDPGLRPRITTYHPNDQDKIRRAYLQKGPCQPKNHNFPQKKVGTSKRRFSTAWFTEFGSWLEYSIEKDAAYCLCCYLFRPDQGNQGGGETFVTKGFNKWNNKERITLHVGSPNSAHNIAFKKCQDLMKQDQHIDTVMSRHSDTQRNIYRTRLKATIDCVCWLLKQGLAFRGHDESKGSTRQGNFLELLKFLAMHNDLIKNVVLDNAPENHQLIAPTIQKDIAHAAASETTNAIIADIGNEFFAILVDEARDISTKEQKAIALLYVNKTGSIVERFLGIVHVKDTTSSSLKSAIDELFCKHGLSISSIRGQGYDGASNMSGEFNGLKSLILRENPCAYYVHCFAHQLQLTLVAIAQEHGEVSLFFNLVSKLMNVVGGSCKRVDMLHEKQLEHIREELSRGEISSGQGLNQETNLARPADTRWSSHYITLVRIILMYSAIIDVLHIMKEDGYPRQAKGEASGLLIMLQGFDFVFFLHLMRRVLGISHELSQSLQRKDQDIMNAMNLVNITKTRFASLRNDGWEPLLKEVTLFCNKQSISVPPMESVFVSGQSRRQTRSITTEHHYRVELFYTVIDMQLQELNDRFSEINTQLLLCLASLDPSNLFSAFDKAKVLEFASFYPNEFTPFNLVMLDNALDCYIMDMRTSDEFASLEGLQQLSEKLVEKGRHVVYPLVYLLLKLALILPVATATVERAFSAMNIVKNRLRNRIGDTWMNDCLVTYIESDVFNNIDSELIVQRFQNMKSRRGQL